MPDCPFAPRRDNDEIILFGSTGHLLQPNFDLAVYFRWLQNLMVRTFGQELCVVPADTLEMVFFFNTGHTVPTPEGETLVEVVCNLEWVHYSDGNLIVDWNNELEHFYNEGSGSSTSGSSSVNSEDDLQALYGPGFVEWVGEVDVSGEEEETVDNGLPGMWHDHECEYFNVFGCPFIRDVLLGRIDYLQELHLPLGCMSNVVTICHAYGIYTSVDCIRLVPSEVFDGVPAMHVPIPQFLTHERVGDSSDESDPEEENCGVPYDLPREPVLVIALEVHPSLPGERASYSYIILDGFLDRCMLD